MADSDRPGGIIEIPESLSRDMEKAEQGKIPAPPIEAFLSDDAVQQIEAASAVNTQPLHAESLRPITLGEANARTTFNGESLQNMPAPRRVIPPPFRRPRIDGGSHGKTWQNVRAEQVVAGDIIPEIGLVTASHEVIRRETIAGRVGVASRIQWVVQGAGGVTRAFSPEAQLTVFRKAELQGRSPDPGLIPLVTPPAGGTMSTGELHAISIQHGPERGGCQCGSCDFHETALSHVAILDMQAHAVQHAMATGHQVEEFAEVSTTVRPLGRM